MDTSDDQHQKSGGPERVKVSETLHRHPPVLELSFRLGDGGDRFELSGESLANETPFLGGVSDNFVETTSGMVLVSSRDERPGVFTSEFIERALKTTREPGAQAVSIWRLPESVVEETGYSLALTVFTHGEAGEIRWQTVLGPSEYFSAEIIDALLTGWKPKVGALAQGRVGAEGVLHQVFENIIFEGLVTAGLSSERRRALLKPMQDLWIGLGLSSSSWSEEWTEFFILDDRVDSRQPAKEPSRAVQPSLGGVIYLEPRPELRQAA
jgi:hypothetical protein